MVKQAAMKYLQCLAKLKVSPRMTLKFLEDSDTEYMAEEPIPGNKEESHQLQKQQSMLKVNS